MLVLEQMITKYVRLKNINMNKLFPHPGIPNFNISQEYVDNMKKITERPGFKESVDLVKYWLNNADRIIKEQNNK
jgi:hypothetical protein